MAPSRFRIPSRVAPRGIGTRAARPSTTRSRPGPVTTEIRFQSVTASFLRAFASTISRAAEFPVSTSNRSSAPPPATTAGCARGAAGGAPPPPPPSHDNFTILPCNLAPPCRYQEKALSRIVDHQPVLAAEINGLPRRGLDDEDPRGDPRGCVNRAPLKREPVLTRPCGYEPEAGVRLHDERADRLVFDLRPR